MLAYNYAADEPAGDFPVQVPGDEVRGLLAAALVGSVVEATFRVRALTEIAAASTPQLCATAAAPPALRRR